MKDEMKFQSTRETVVRTCCTLADKGFLAGTGGNVALRVDDTHFAVTPSAVDYYTMTPEDVCILRLADLKRVDSDRKPSVECGLHAKVLRARSDCQASIHTHQPIASAYTLLARSLEIQSPQLRQLLGVRIPCAGYAPSGTGWLSKKVAKCVNSDVHAYLMRNHGVVCVGADVEIAMRRVGAIEEACARFFEQQLVNQKQHLSEGLVCVVRRALTTYSIKRKREESL